LDNGIGLAIEDFGEFHEKTSGIYQNSMMIFLIVSILYTLIWLFLSF